MRILTNVTDIFNLPIGPSEAVCVTTNGIIKQNGRAVMGRGIAKTADDRFDLSRQLAHYLLKYGNRLFYMGVKRDAVTGHEMSIITFPTKHHWRDKSDIELIRTSAKQLVSTCDKFGITKCYLPCPGCANGGLDWEIQVEPVLEPILDDRFIIADSALR